MIITDTHTHIQMPQFNKDRAEVIANALEHDVARMICPGTDIPTSVAAIELAQQRPEHIFAAVGVHPHDTSGFSAASINELRRLAQNTQVVAIGEIGLDFYRNLSPADDQIRAFTAQVTLAKELAMPIIIHSREAHRQIMDILQPYGAVRGVMHCFIGDEAMAEEALALGLYISFAGPVTYPANTTLADVAAWVPADRMLIETDAPYLSPHPMRRDRNEPAKVRRVAQKIAELRGVSLEEIAAITTANAAKLFRLPEPAA